LAGVLQERPDLADEVEIGTGTVGHGNGPRKADLDRSQRIELALSDNHWLARMRCVSQAILIPESPWFAGVLPKPLLRAAVLVVDRFTVPTIRDDEIAPSVALPIGVKPVTGRDLEI